MTTGALRRVVRRAAQRSGGAESCGLCAAAVGPEHRHVLDVRDGPLLCVCTACTLLFTGDAAGGDRYRLVPTRRSRVTDAPVEDLDVPVGLAFFVKQGDGRVLAHYPGPFGTTGSTVDAAAWVGVEARSPTLAGLTPLVEALLIRVDAPRGIRQRWILPVDDCYRLVALIRRRWTGMSGGSGVWREITRFFDELAASGEGGKREGSGDG